MALLLALDLMPKVSMISLLSWLVLGNCGQHGIKLLGLNNNELLNRNGLHEHISECI